MATNPLGGRTPDNVTRVNGGVGYVREHTIEIGATVIWIDNIGSIYVLEAQRSYLFLIAGILAALAGLSMLQSDFMVGAVLLAIGGGLIYLNLQQKVDSGISIGTVDGRRTLIISKDREFIDRTLNFIRDKIDSGSASLQGTIDVTNNHFDSHGGGMVVTDGLAMDAGGEPIPRTSQPQPAHAFEGARSQPQRAMDDYVQQARSLYQRGAAEIAPRLSEFMKAQNWPEHAPMLVAMLALALGVIATEIGVLTMAYMASAAVLRTPMLTHVLISVAALAGAWFAVVPSRLADRGGRPLMLTVLLLLSAALTAASGFLAPDYLLALIIALVALKALATPLAIGLVGDAFADSNRASGMGAVLGGVSLAGFLIGASQGWAAEKFGFTFAPIVYAAIAGAVALVGMRFVREGERERDAVTPSFGAVWRRIAADRAASNMLAGLTLLAILSPAIIGHLNSQMFFAEGADRAEAAGQRAITWAIAAAIGALGGGFASDYLGRNDIRLRGWLSAGCTIAGALFAVFGWGMDPGPGNIVGAVSIALIAAAAPPAYGIVMYAAGWRGRTSAAALIQFLTAFVALALGPLLLTGAAALIGRTSEIDFGYAFPGVASWAGDGHSQSFSSILPIELRVQFEQGAARAAVDMGALFVAALMAWPAWCFFRGGQALDEPQPAEQDEPFMRGGPPGALIGALGLVALAGVIVFPVLAARPDSRQTFAPSADASATPQATGALRAVSAQAPLAAAALDEAPPSLLDRLYRMLPHRADPAWNDIARVALRFGCDADQACGFALNTQLGQDADANLFAPGAAFAGFEAQRVDERCELNHNGRTVISDFCLGDSGNVEIFAPAAQSRVSLIAYSASNGGYRLVAFDARRGETLFNDAALGDCAPTALSWSPNETRVLIGAGCGNGAMQLTLLDLSRRFYAQTNAPAELLLNYDFANTQGEQHFAGRWLFYPSQVRLRGRNIEADLVGHLDQVDIGLQTVFNGIASPDGALAWFGRLHPTLTVGAALSADGLAYSPSDSAPMFAWTPPGANEAQSIVDQEISAAYGAEPASVSACQSATMCWTVVYANGTPPPLQLMDGGLELAADAGLAPPPQQQYPAVAGRWAGEATQDGRRGTAVQVAIDQKHGEIEGAWRQSVVLLGPVQTRFRGAIGADGSVRFDRVGVDGDITRYSGTLSPDGTTISGRWQRGATVGSFHLQRN